MTSRSSAPGTSACRSRRCSPRPDGGSSSSTSTPRRVERLLQGDSYIEDVSSETLAALVADRRLDATTDYDVLRDADAILIALPTPLSKQREPDLSIVRHAASRDRQAPPPRPARRARVDDVSRDDARRGAPDPRAGVGPRSGQRLPPRVLARARRPRPHRLDDQDRPEGRRRDRRRLDRGCRRALRLGRGHDPSGLARPRRRS